MSLASFFGTAAQSADQSMRAWQEIFLRRDELEQRREQFDEELGFRREELDFRQEDAAVQRTFLRGLEDLRHQNNMEIAELNNRFDISADKRRFANDSALQTARQEHDFALEEFRTDAARELFDEQAGIELAKETLRLAQVPGVYTAEEIVALANEFSSRGGRVAEYAAPLRAMARSGLIDNPQEAIAYYDQVLQASNDPNSTFVPNRVLFDAAVEVITSTMGEDAAKEFTSTAERIYATATTEGEATAANIMEAQGLELDRVRAEIGQTQAATEESQARTEGVRMQTLREQYALNNLDPLRAEQMVADTRRTLSEIENIDSETLINTIRASALPQQLALDIQSVAAEIRATEAGAEGQLLQNQIVQQTMDAVIEEAFVGLDLTKTQRDLAQSELRVAVSTEMLRTSLMRADLEGTQAATDLTRTNIELAHAQMERMAQDGELTQAQIDGYRQEMRLAALDVLSNAKATGDLDTVRDLGIQLLTEAGISDPEAVIDNWVDATAGANSLREEREALELRMVTAEVDRAEFVVATQEEDRLNDIAQQEVENELAWADIAIRQEYNDILRSQRTPGTGTTLTPESTWERMGFGATGGAKFVENVSQLRQAVTDAGLIDNIADTTRLAELGGGLWEDIRSTALTYLQTKTGMNPANMTPSQVIANLPAPLNDPSNGLSVQLLREWGLLEGNEESTAAEDAATISAELDMDPTDVANAAWEMMDEEERQGYTNELGIPSASVLADEVRQEQRVAQAEQREYNADVQTVTRLGQTVFGMTPGENGFDLAQRQELLGLVNERMNRIDTAIEQLRNLGASDPFGLDPAAIPRILYENGLSEAWNSGPSTVQDLIVHRGTLNDGVNSIIRINQR